MDWELTCRVCLEGGEMVSLFDCDEKNELLSEKYKYTTGIEIEETESLPTLICLTCVDRLMFAYQFKQQCVTSNDTLKECLLELTKSNSTDDGIPGEEHDINFIPRHAEQKPKTETRKRKVGRPPKMRPREQEETLKACKEPPEEEALEPKPKSVQRNKTKPAEKYERHNEHACEKCGSTFGSDASLQAHMRRHLGIKPYVCSVCSYSCVLVVELRRHMKRHKRPHKCRMCEKRYGDPGSRLKHERLHLGERPFQCSCCGKSFTSTFNLNNHVLTHTGEKKYSCDICNKKITKAHHLKYHYKVHHKEAYLQQQLQLEEERMNMQSGIINEEDSTRE